VRLVVAGDEEDHLLEYDLASCQAIPFTLFIGHGDEGVMMLKFEETSNWRRHSEGFSGVITCRYQSKQSILPGDWLSQVNTDDRLTELSMSFSRCVDDKRSKSSLRF